MTIDILNNRPGSRFGLFKGDGVIWVIFFFLCAISLLEVFSASSFLTYKSSSFLAPIRNHATYLLIGLLVVVLTHNIPCRWFKFYPFLVGPVAIICLLVLSFSKVMTNGAARWLEIPGVGITFQPSELAKGVVIIGVAFILSFLQTEKGADRHAFKYILWVSVPFIILIFFENFSTAFILGLVVLMMMFVGRIPFVQIGKLLGVLAVAIGAFAFFLIVTPDSTLDQIPKGHRFATWKHRVQHFMPGNTKEVAPEDFDIDKEAQVAHANIAIATSNVVGKFPGNSVERDFLSHAFSDFIFAIIIEEMGLIGCAFVVLLYVVLLFRAGKIANKCERNFPAFLVLGLSLLLVTQAFVNMMVAVGLFPVTGQPLPLVSKGGSSTLINCLYIGMILSVSRFAKRRVTSKNQRQEVAPVVNEDEFTRTDGMA